MSNIIPINSIKTSNSALDMLDMMERAYKFAEIMAASDIVPVHYRNKPANVFIVVQSACRMNIDPYLMMQNTYVNNGTLAMRANFAISLANRSGILDSIIRYRVTGEGKDLQVTAYANLKNTDEEISFTITMKQAELEGWTRNSKYKTLPELMLMYRSATLLIRTHIPESLNGLHVVEEIEDVTTSQNIPTRIQSINTKLDHLLSPQVIEDDKPYLELITLIGHYGVSEELQQKWCDKAGVKYISELTDEQIAECIKVIEKKYVATEIED